MADELYKLESEVVALEKAYDVVYDQLATLERDHEDLKLENRRLEEEVEELKEVIESMQSVALDYRHNVVEAVRSWTDSLIFDIGVEE